MRSCQCLSFKTELYKYVHYVVEIHCDFGIKASVQQTVLQAQFNGEPYTCASRTLLSICRVKESKVHYSKDVLKTVILFWVYKEAKSWNSNEGVWIKKTLHLNTWKKILLVSFYKFSARKRKTFLIFELRCINNQVLNILKCA